MSSRRRLLGKVSGLASAIGLAGCLGQLPIGDEERESTPTDDGRRTRQHAMNDALRTDEAGNPLTPRHHLVLLLRLHAPPSETAAERVETAMTDLEAAYDWRPDGLFHRLAWGTSYFERIGELEASPIRAPTVLSRTDEPNLLEFDAALVLSTDERSHLRATDAAMFGDRATLNGHEVSAKLGAVFDVVERRSGFVGEGLPAEHADVDGIPDDHAVSEAAPMFTGFFSGLRKTQASEDRVTIRSGPYAGGTTMHLSHLRLSLDGWFTGMDEAGRVARMFSPRFTPADVEEFDTDVPRPDKLARVAEGFGVVGHQEKVAQAREDGRPVILRRDFNTVDGGEAGLHFLSLQRSLADFVRTRDAMNGWWLRDESPTIGEQQNNGILDFLTVRSRANFYVPPRNERAFPAL